MGLIYTAPETGTTWASLRETNSAKRAGGCPRGAKLRELRGFVTGTAGTGLIYRRSTAVVEGKDDGDGRSRNASHFDARVIESKRQGALRVLGEFEKEKYCYNEL